MCIILYMYVHRKSKKMLTPITSLLTQIEILVAVLVCCSPRKVVNSVKKNQNVFLY